MLTVDTLYLLQNLKNKLVCNSAMQTETHLQSLYQEQNPQCQQETAPGPHPYQNQQALQPAVTAQDFLLFALEDTPPLHCLCL